MISNKIRNNVFVRKKQRAPKDVCTARLQLHNEKKKRKRVAIINVTFYFIYSTKLNYSRTRLTRGRSDQ